MVTWSEIIRKLPDFSISSIAFLLIFLNATPVVNVADGVWTRSPVDAATFDICLMFEKARWHFTFFDFQFLHFHSLVHKYQTWTPLPWTHPKVIRYWFQQNACNMTWFYLCTSWNNCLKWNTWSWFLAVSWTVFLWLAIPSPQWIFYKWPFYYIDYHTIYWWHTVMNIYYTN